MNDPTFLLFFFSSSLPTACEVDLLPNCVSRQISNDTLFLTPWLHFSGRSLGNDFDSQTQNDAARLPCLCCACLRWGKKRTDGASGGSFLLSDRRWLLGYYPALIPTKSLGVSHTSQCSSEHSPNVFFFVVFCFRLVICASSVICRLVISICIYSRFCPIFMRQEQPSYFSAVVLSFLSSSYSKHFAL